MLMMQMSSMTAARLDQNLQPSQNFIVWDADGTVHAQHLTHHSMKIQQLQ